MTVILLGLVLLSFSAPLSLVLHKKIEEMIPISILGIILILYVAGLCGNLAVGFHIVLRCALIAFLVLVYIVLHLSRNVFSVIFTPGFIAFLILLFFIWHAHHEGRMYTEWDELCHWGLFTKNMYSTDQLYNAPGSTALVHPDYPPATSLFSYFGLKLDGSYRECNAYYCANIFLYSLVLPIFKHFDWRKPLSLLFVFGITLLIPFTVFANQLFATNNLFSIYVDTPLGFFFAYVLFQYFSSQYCKSDLIFLCLSLFTLTLLKPIGIGFSLLVCFLISADILFIQKTWSRRQRIMWIAVPLISALVGKFSWSIYLKLSDTPSDWNTSALTPSALMSFLKREGEPYQYETYHNFLDYFCDSPLRYLIYFIVISALFIFLLAKKKDRLRVAVFSSGILIGFLVYSAALLILYLFTFSSYEAVRLASCDRYISTYYYGMFGFLLYVIVDYCASEYPTKINPAPVLLVCMLPLVQFNHVNDFLLHPDISIAESISYRKSLSVPQNIVDVLDLKNDRVYVIAQESNGVDNVFIRYQLTPMTPSTGPYSLGPSYSEEDVWSVNITVEEWAKLLKDYTHLYVAHTDDRFKSLYGSLFQDPNTLSDKTLYRIEKDGDNIRLIFEMRGQQ